MVESSLSLLHGAKTTPRKWRAAELCKVYRKRKPSKAGSLNPKLNHLPQDSEALFLKMKPRAIQDKDLCEVRREFASGLNPHVLCSLQLCEDA